MACVFVVQYICANMRVRECIVLARDGCCIYACMSLYAMFVFVCM
jgi:hypothetical protein